DYYCMVWHNKAGFF
nr:immunoglobulin light chain junction region [Macaca mulatta]